MNEKKKISLLTINEDKTYQINYKIKDLENFLLDKKEEKKKKTSIKNKKKRLFKKKKKEMKLKNNIDIEEELFF